MFKNYSTLTPGQIDRLQREPDLTPVQRLADKALVVRVARRSGAHYQVLERDGSVFEFDQYYSNLEGFERRRIVHTTIEWLRGQFQDYFGYSADPELASALETEMDAVLCGRPLQLWPMNVDPAPPKRIPEEKRVKIKQLLQNTTWPTEE